MRYLHQTVGKKKEWKRLKALDRIKHSFETAMADTDNRLLTQTNARTTTRSKKGLTQEEAKKMLEAETPKTADKK